MTTKAVLLNLGVFSADNNTRRSLSALAYNFTSPTAAVNRIDLRLLPGELVTWNTPVTSSSFSLISAESPLKVSVTLAPEGANPAVSYTLDNVRLHILDKDVRQIVIENTGTTTVPVLIVQS
jgi:hypothetical protein